jgi:hypothetical protein
MAIEFVHGCHDAILEFRFGRGADVAEHGAGELSSARNKEQFSLIAVFPCDFCRTLALDKREFRHHTLCASGKSGKRSEDIQSNNAKQAAVDPTEDDAAIPSQPFEPKPARDVVFP